MSVKSFKFDSQATAKAMCNIKVNSKSNGTAITELSKLVKENQVLLQWILPHNGYAGNGKRLC